MHLELSGTVEPGWEPVRDAFVANFTEGEDIGAGTAVYHRGRKMVDLTGGSFAPESDRRYDDTTLQLVFSTTKGITAIAVALCVQRGLLDYDDAVATYWPEFAEQAKTNVTVAEVLSHQAGLITVDGELTLPDALDWPTITSRLARTAPCWPLGEGHGYHALTYGWLAGELVRRVDPRGRAFGRFVADEIVGPLGSTTEFYVGLPEALEARVSPIIGAPLANDSTNPSIKEMMDLFLGPDTLGGKALTLSGTFAQDGVFNRRDVHAAEVPAANGITNAASLARIYAATIGDVDGVRLLDANVLDRARTTVTPAGEPDKCLYMATTFGMGFMTHGAFTPFGGPGSFGHPGAGGSVGFALPELDLAFGYVMNRMASNLADDPRAASLTNAAVVCARSVS